MFKKQEGITLIALVITIIVLLILAGVSISLVVGNNGVLTQASTAVVNDKIANAREALNMALAATETKFYSKRVNNSALTRSEVYNTKDGVASELVNLGYTLVEPAKGFSFDTKGETVVLENEAGERFTCNVTINNETGKVQYTGYIILSSKNNNGKYVQTGSMSANPTTSNNGSGNSGYSDGYKY